MEAASPYPCLWFDKEAEEALSACVAALPPSEMLASSAMACTAQLRGLTLMGLNGGPLYVLNGALSFYAYCGSAQEVDRLHGLLMRGGEARMPLGSYGWSPRYAWVRDRFGIEWQLDAAQAPEAQQIVPTLLFAGPKAGLLREALSHYLSIFPGSEWRFSAPQPPEAGLPADALLFAQVSLGGMLLNATSSPQDHGFDFSPATSIVVPCETQAEIDHYWDRLCEGGQPGRCGWLEDRFGVSWQIVPAKLPQWVADPERGPRVVEAFLQMQKFDIAALMRA